MLGIEVRNKNIRRARTQERGDETGDFRAHSAAEGGFAGFAAGVGDGGNGVEIDVVVADPQEMQSVGVHAAGDVILDLQLSARSAPARLGEFVAVEVGRGRF